MRVLVLAAHPDDEVLGCGATLSRLSKEGHEVHVAIFGEGVSSRYKNREDAKKEELQALTEASKTAGRILEVSSVQTLGLPDNRFDSLHLLDIVKKAEALIHDIGPSLVFTHHPSDLNVDHRLLFQATLTACRPIVDHPVKQILCFEIPSSTEWSFQRIEPVFRPSVFYDVTKTLENKLNALDVYESETSPFPHPRSRKAILAYAHRWGSAVGVEAAEAFELLRELK